MEFSLTELGKENGWNRFGQIMFELCDFFFYVSTWRVFLDEINIESGEPWVKQTALRNVSGLSPIS